MFTPAEFDAIRAYEDRDLGATIKNLFADEAFRSVLQSLFPNQSLPLLEKQLSSYTSILEFQKNFIHGLVTQLIQKTGNGLTLDISALTNKGLPYTYISNHRDIILDSALLDILLIDAEFPQTVEIAIGDNLLVYPWIKHLVRLNKAFIVQRSLSLREMLVASKLMSRYMHFVITQKKNPIWIAQREGRAKDGNDRTQEAVLKMIAMGGEGTATERLMAMHIVPLSISYEFDPCDFLKAKEFQMKRDNPAYKKTRADDLVNMQTGLFGYKGRVHYACAPCIDDWIATRKGLSNAEFFAATARRLDEEIYRNYRLYPNNFVALDLLNNEKDYISHYSEEDKVQFEQYLQQQIDKIDLPNKDEAFLRERLLEMYANPAKNQLAVS
ncbi:1-acyl-sn-glycerol-3-phosphate acyltransferase [Alloprevotella tannerae]|uniref:1-acyl-sn-glycerol-3-phosphate acyltransferase n=1 Tax=Alloprevotella tannerae TaxID=76122 RepID=UPI001EDA17E0|nr:1-acyl-sn-glycerol-3-phosphate acyltransferase [Alloprevotella tannerae]MCG2648494.1 1-acyl-sn-glycerol-3-phosphate acyltransferase [Alloprevotella tannerae]